MLQGESRETFHVFKYLNILINCVECRKSTESLQQQQSSRSAGRFSRTPPNPLAALDRAVRRACRLVMDQLLLDLQPLLPGLVTRPWLAQGDPTPKLCSVLERHLELYGRVRPPCRQVAYVQHVNISSGLFLLLFLLHCVGAAAAGGGPVADGGGVRQGSDAEEDGVSERRGEEAARSADAPRRTAVQRNLPRPGECTEQHT